MQGLYLELAKGAISLVITLIGLGLGWLVSQRLSYQWNLRQKRRELELATAQDLQRMYGEFFSIWKVWNASAEKKDADIVHKLLTRTADAEGLLERVWVKLATKRRLSAVDRETLGKFRQGFQQLRQNIRAETKLDWIGSEHEHYLAFKRLAVAVTQIVQREDAIIQITSAEAFESLRDITSSEHEKTWWVAKCVHRQDSGPGLVKGEPDVA